MRSNTCLMWFFRRSDVHERNQWSNYSNWEYNGEQPRPITKLARYDYFNNILEVLINAGSIPDFYTVAPNYYHLTVILYAIFNPAVGHAIAYLINFHPDQIIKPPQSAYKILVPDPSFTALGIFTPGYVPSFTALVDLLVGLEGLPPYPLPCPIACPQLGLSNYLYYTASSYIENDRNIMTRWGLYLDGKVRETTMDVGIVNYIEKYIRTIGGAKSGLYCYNFCLSTDPFQYQPSGAMNLSKFNKVEWEFETIEPVDASSVSVSVTCDASGTPIDPHPPTSADKGYWKVFKYSYHLHIMEERYNILLCDNGVGNLVFAR